MDDVEGLEYLVQRGIVEKFNKRGDRIMNINLITADIFICHGQPHEAIIEADPFEEIPNLAVAALNAAADGDNHKELEAIGQKILDCISDYYADEIAEEVADNPPLDYEDGAATASRQIDKANAEEINSHVDY